MHVPANNDGDHIDGDPEILNYCNYPKSSAEL